MRLGFKEGGLGFQEVDQVWNSVGWTCKATPTLNEAEIGFSLMVSSRVVDLFPSERDQRGLQRGHQGKRLSAARLGANVLGWSPGEEVLLGCVLASKRVDLASKRLIELGTAWGWTCKTTTALKPAKVY
ncbi:hypothetical protein PIB30_029431 [Stylosanthes scabra]|uniref:Uncharacterized protein n=1 Tax=Stylosanthes scabra TaxID=79078 RepID=A0ABU6X8U8_9FABA|nr:hypothetical protein [Stylosanthes scabra]